ncbi:TonB-dependent receptor domain-containing protein [Bernardetia sp. OM2101]|uniref:TonB-dependent receptor n=1 Tax=Bernardetia sp. OM2101 TaxID=3344876 RepID=UPI0035CFCC8D
MTTSKFYHLFFSFCFSLFISTSTFAQDNPTENPKKIVEEEDPTKKDKTKNTKKGIVQGTVRDKDTQEPLIGVSVIVLESDPIIGVVTDLEGNYKLEIPVGSYNLEASYVGFAPLKKFNIVVGTGNANNVNFELAESSSNLEGVEIVARKATSASPTTVESPLSTQRLTTEEIKSNPGGNFDISRVVQALPGVGSTSGGGGFRNDIIIRGGAPNENVYYLDGIEIPVINHFATQGSAGGPTGILNVSFIEDVTLNTSAFDARYDNALASVFTFKQKEGNSERLQGNIRLSGTELAATFEAPLGKKTTMLLSARRSYLQFLFALIDLPIRPNYWDFQYKVTHKFNEKTTLTAIGVGAIDDFSFEAPEESTPESEYILRSSPSINQWNYTTGFALKRLVKDGYVNVALSRNMFDNCLDQFEDRQENEEFRTLLLESQEIENKLRIDVNKSKKGWKYAYGIVGQYVKFNNDIFNRLRKEIRDSTGNIIQPEVQINYNSAIDFFRYGAFGQVSKTVLNNKLGLSFGVRTDMNTFMDTGNNPLETLSPRLSASYYLNDEWSINGSVGRYFKIPIYTVLGFQNENGEFVNKSNKYISSTHYVLGTEFLPRASTRFTVEGFYKNYANYPVSVRDGISLANQGGGFGAIGNEAVTSTGEGRAYGFEFLFQQKLISKIFAVFSYTFVRSEFAGTDGELISSAWDNGHLISGILGRKFGKGWEMGLRYRFAAGSPYTPFDLLASQRNYLTTGNGVLDNSRLNSERLGNFSQLDFRLDKKINFKKITLDLYIDIQNALLQGSPQFPRYTFARTDDNSGFQTTDGQPINNDGSNAVPFILEDSEPSVLPTIGFILEF